MKIDKKTLIIGILIVAILVIGGVYAYTQIKENYYLVGFQDATLLINNQIIQNLIQNGFITVYVPYQNQTRPVKLVPLQEN